MKYLKYLLILLVVLVLLGFGYVAIQPSDYDVTRSKVIKAPVSKVFNTVNDLKTWEKWGPWHDEDSTIVVTHGDKSVGVGANNSWTSKDGPGKMKTVALETNKSIDQKIWMMNLEGEPDDIYWKFAEVDGGTKVTWGMKSNKASFMFKIIAALMGGWDAMLGPMEENGLNNLAKVIAETPDAYRLSEVSKMKLEAKKFIGYPVKMKINHEEMTKAFMDNMPKAGMYAMKSGLQYGDYLPAAVYTKYDETSGETEFYIGLVLHKDLKPADGMMELNLPPGEGLKISKFGQYGTGDFEAHTALANYLSKHKMEQSFPIWETYPNDPTQVKESDIQTDIYYPIK